MDSSGLLFEAASSSDFSTTLQMLDSCDIMMQYEGISQLRTQLQSAQESTLHRFPFEQCSQRLIKLLRQPCVMDFSYEIKSKKLFRLYALQIWRFSVC